MRRYGRNRCEPGRCSSIGRVPTFDGSIATSRAKEFAVGREREGTDVLGVALQRVRYDGISLVEAVGLDELVATSSCQLLAVGGSTLHKCRSCVWSSSTCTHPLATLPRLRPKIITFGAVLTVVSPIISEFSGILDGIFFFTLLVN